MGERREELKVGAGVALVQGLQDPDQGPSCAQSPDQGQGLAQNLDLESPDPGQSADQGPGVDPRGPGVGPKGLEVGQEGPDPGRPSQAAAQGLGQAAQQNQNQEAQQSQDQAVQEDQDLGVLPNLDLGVQQCQDPKSHQGQGQGLPEIGGVNHQFKCTLFVLCGLQVPLYHQLNHIFGFV